MSSDLRMRYGPSSSWSAATTEAVRRAIQHSQESLRALAIQGLPLRHGFVLIAGGPLRSPRREERETTGATLASAPLPATSSPPRKLDQDPLLLREPIQRHIGPRAEMLDDFSRGERAEPPAVVRFGARAPGRRDSRRRTCRRRRSYRPDRAIGGGNLPGLSPSTTTRSLFRAGDDASTPSRAARRTPRRDAAFHRATAPRRSWRIRCRPFPTASAR